MKYFSKFSKTFLVAALAGIFLWACVGKPDDPDEPDILDEPNEPYVNIVNIDFDKTEYYPFEMALIELNEAASMQEYSGMIDGFPITAYRVDDFTLALSLPDLAKGQYALSLNMATDVKGEGTFNVVALPEVEDPEAVIEEITASFAQTIAEAVESANPNAPLIVSLLEVLDEQLALMTPAERKQFAALWQTQPDIDDLLDINSLSRYNQDRDRELTGMMIEATRRMQNVVSCIKPFAVLLPFTPVPGIGFLAAAGATAFFIKGVYNFVKLIAVHEKIMDFVFVAVKESFGLTKFSTYDYTLKNGETLAFAPEITYRSITSEDAGSTLETARQVITVVEEFQSIWDDIMAGINKLRNYSSKIVPALDNRPQKVSEISTPLAEETVAIENWTLQIVSGNVTAQKTTDDTYTFSTTLPEYVEFQFVIRSDEMEGIETRVYTALLEVGEYSITLQNGHEGVDYNISLFNNFVDENMNVDIIGGSLPKGLTLDETGVVSGIPAETGEFTIIVRVDINLGYYEKEFTITINDNPLVGTWWSFGKWYSEYHRWTQTSVNDFCGNSIEVSSLEEYYEAHSNNLGEVTFTADGKFHYKICGVSYVGTYSFERYFDSGKRIRYNSDMYIPPNHEFPQCFQGFDLAVEGILHYTNDIPIKLRFGCDSYIKVN